MFALLHAPSPNMADAVRTFAHVEPIDLDRVGHQHAEYRRALERAGATCIELAVHLDCPDAIFIEDTAVILDEIAVLGSMGTPSRVREVQGVEPELRRRRPLARIEGAATLEGGDVLRVGRILFVGATSRTNAGGADALARIAEPLGYEVRRVETRGCLHLKTACTALPDGTMLVVPGCVDERALGAPTLSVADGEVGGANVVVIGRHVIMAAAFPKTIALVQARGFDVIAVDLSEIAKAEGSATCLSLLVA